MINFFMKHAGTIILMVICLSVGGFTDSVLDKLFPPTAQISKVVLTELFVSALESDEVRTVLIEIVKSETEGIIKDIREIKQHEEIESDNTAEEWVRVMNKQYTKVQDNRDDLSWKDVDFALSKWKLLPDKWVTPELESKINYLKIKYDDYINGGGI